MKLVDDKGIVATFSPSRDGEYGFFATNDEAIVERLKKFSGMYGSVIKEVEGSNLPSFDIHNYGSGGYAELAGLLGITRDHKAVNEIQASPKIQIDPNDYIRFGELKASILRTSGEYRRDATDEQIKEYENLKLKIGV